jgi:arginyl-tRNA synthetase
MATTTISTSQLQVRLGELVLNSAEPDVPAADVSTKPLDIYRIHLARLVASTVGCEVALAFEAIASTNDSSIADLTLVLPKLRLKDVDVKTYAFDIIKKVLSECS